MANRWGNNGNSEDFIFWDSKVTADGECSHEVKRCLLLGRKTMTNLDSVLKNRDIILPTKVSIQKTKIMASGPNTPWQVDEETKETVRDYFWGLQDHCRW